MRRERREVEFSGRVQGVGFRYTTCRVAGEFEVVGFVQNTPTGRVLLVAEGEPAELDRFVAAVREAMGACIHDVRSSSGEAGGEFTSFEIR